MGKKIRDQAEKLGLTKLRTTILYARPRKIRMMAFKSKPDIADIIRNYMKELDSSFVDDGSGGAKNMTFYCLAPNANLYVEIADRAVYPQVKPGNHAIKISIFSDKDEHIRGIANVVNQRWEDGIIPNMNWSKIESTYNIKKEDVIAAWNHLLNMKSSPDEPSKQIDESERDRFCTHCGKKLTTTNLNFCTECGKKL